METLTCNRCKEEKSIDCFYITKTGTPYKVCKDCNKNIYKEKKMKKVESKEVVINITNNTKIIFKMLKYTPSYDDFVAVSKLLIDATSLDEVIDVILETCKNVYPKDYMKFCVFLFTSYPSIEEEQNNNPLYDCVKDKELIGEDIQSDDEHFTMPVTSVSNPDQYCKVKVKRTN